MYIHTHVLSSFSCVQLFPTLWTIAYKGDQYTFGQGFEWMWLHSTFLFLRKIKFLISARVRNEESALLGSLHCKWRDGCPESKQSTLLGNLCSTMST